MAAGALSRAQTAMQRAEDQRRAADARRRKLTDSLTAERQGKERGRGANPRWNTLQSQLDDGLRQVRGQMPPERYRSAIERYFELISGKPTEESGTRD
jgi:hypothetical protein